MANNSLYVKFSNIDKEFPIVDGATFKDTLNETLDSATIIVSKIKLEDRLELNPYDFVCVYNKAINQVDNFQHYYLIDNYVEKEVNIHDRIFQYTIELMSLTKLLEKIQLPNRTISHSLVSGRKTIKEYLEHFINFYSPKVKYTNGTSGTWSYRQLITINDTLLGDKFDVECRDFSFSNPTLRQVLTTLMLQVHCLPILIQRNDTVFIDTQLQLSFIDLNVEGKNKVNIRENPSINYITRSNASDSFVNTLTNLGENILDEGNIVKVNNIGFRDNNTALLKQQDNLKLTVQYPIYNVNKLVLKCYALNNQMSFISTVVKKGATPDTSWFYISGGYNNVDTGFSINFNVPGDQNGVRIALENADVFISVKDMTAYYSVLETYHYDYKDLARYNIEGEYAGSSLVFDSDYIKSLIAVRGDLYACVRGTLLIRNVDGTIERHPFQDTTYHAVGSSDSFTIANGVAVRLYEKDITCLCVEKNKRQLLDTDFLAMEEVETIESLSKYLYGTVEYEIGGTEIKGFSSTYSLAQGWWNIEKTYLENILQVIGKQDPFGKYIEEFENNILGGFEIGFNDSINYQYELSDYICAPINPFLSDLLHPNYRFGNIFVFFDIEYQPLNTANTKYVKENENNKNYYSIEQLDNSSNGIINFNDFSQSEKEKVNRLGNDIIAVNQRTPYANEIYEVGTTIEEDYIIYQREIARSKYYYEVNYYASKSSVLKTYITSIETKYRAYEYIDYNQAVERKENKLFYVLVDSKVKYDGTDSLVQYYNSVAYENYIPFVSSIDHIKRSEYYLKYSYESENAVNFYVFDLSELTYFSGFVLSFRERDNQSYGNYIRLFTESDQYAKLSNLGGVPQGWYIKSDEWLSKSFIGFVNTLKYDFRLIQPTTNISNISEDLTKVVEYPKIPIENSSDLISNNYTLCISNQESRKDFNYFFTDYFFDRGEYLNQSVQFEYFSLSNDIKFSRYFFEFNQMIYDREENNYQLALIKTSDFSVFNTPKSYSSSDILTTTISPIVSVSSIILNDFIQVNWNNSVVASEDYIKVAVNISNVWYDLCVFNKANSKVINGFSEYNISICDTKTTIVATHDNRGQLDFSKYEVSSSRNIKNKEV